MSNEPTVSLSFMDYDHQYNRYADIHIFADDLKVVLKRSMEADDDWEGFTDCEPEPWEDEKSLHFSSATHLVNFVTTLVEALCTNNFAADINQSEESNRELIHSHCKKALEAVDLTLSLPGDDRQSEVADSVFEDWADCSRNSEPMH